LLSINLLAQSDSTLTTDQIIQDLLEESSIDLEEDYLYDLLEELQDNPININTADINTLLTIPFLDLNSVQAILDFRKRFGKFFHVRELLAIETLDPNIARALQFFTTTEEVITKPLIDLSGLSGEFRSRFVRDLQDRQGFLSGNYAGDEFKSYQRAKIKFGNFNLAGLIEKDPGESKINDFTSFSVSLNDYSYINKFTLGDYLIEFGQGLIYWGPYSFGKGAEAVRTVSRSAKTIRDYTSTDENQFYRGAAGNFIYDNFDLTVFYSYNKRDANVDTSTGELTSLPISGYHRTEGERSRFHQSAERALGGILSVDLFNSIRIGFAYQNLEYDHPIEQSDLFDPYGKSFNFYSTTYSFVYDNVRISGEAAYNEVSVASINSIEWILSNKLSFVTSVRNYPRNFYTFKGTGFGEGSNTSNEFGIYNGIKWRSDFGIINFYFDQFKFPYESFTSDYPSSGNEFLFDYQFRPATRTLLNLRVKREFKEVTQNIDGSPTSLDQYRTNVRINYDYYVLRNLRMRSRIEYVFFDQSIVETHEKGYLLFQDFRYDALDQLRFYGRIVLFETDSFNSRVYQFENDVRGVLNNPALFGKGIRWYLMIEYDLFDFARISAKYSELYKPDEVLLSSGNSQINNNLDNRLTFQLDIKF
jgi:hypothetical protein